MQTETGTGTRHAIDTDRGERILDAALAWGRTGGDGSDSDPDGDYWDEYTQTIALTAAPADLADLIYAYALSGATAARQLAA